MSSVVMRPGQSEFRIKLLRAYECRCAITGCGVDTVLEAAHIIPYRNAASDHIGNGLLLRADIHKLFDAGMVTVDETTMQVVVSPTLAGTEYERYQGSQLRLPKAPSFRPSCEALNRHRLGQFRQF